MAELPDAGSSAGERDDALLLRTGAFGAPAVHQR
jgi:hypothetical protein